MTDISDIRKVKRKLSFADDDNQSDIHNQQISISSSPSIESTPPPPYYDLTKKATHESSGPTRTDSIKNMNVSESTTSTTMTTGVDITGGSATTMTTNAKPKSIIISRKSKSKSKLKPNHNDTDLVSAAEALTQLTKTITPPLSNSKTENNQIYQNNDNDNDNQNNNKLIAPTLQPVNSNDDSNTEHPLVTKVTKVSKHPIVTNAVKYYESQKRNYPHFNYAAGIVEKAAIPMVNKIEFNLNNRYQLKQLKSQKRRKIKDERERNVSIETKKRLQFCLHLLKLANDQINNKVLVLQQKIIDKERDKLNKSRQKQQLKQQREIDYAKFEGDDQVIDNDSSETLIDENTPPTSPTSITSIPNEAAQQTKTEIITTVKKIIHVISNFKPSSLNASDQHDDLQSSDDEEDDDENNQERGESNNNNDIKSIQRPNLSRKNSQNSQNSDNQHLKLKSTIRDIILKLPATVQQTSITQTTSTKQANDRIFVFAKESLDMIGKLTNVFNEQLEKAENWVNGEEEIQEEEEEEIFKRKNELSIIKESDQHQHDKVINENNQQLTNNQQLINNDKLMNTNDGDKKISEITNGQKDDK